MIHLHGQERRKARRRARAKRVAQENRIERSYRSFRLSEIPEVDIKSYLKMMPLIKHIPIRKPDIPAKIP